MKTLAIATMLLGTASIANATPAQLHGSDTLFGATTDAINQVGLQNALTYVGGGSGTGEAGLMNGTQGIAPMSRALSDSAVASLLDQGVTPVQNVIGLDGVSLFVKATESVAQLDIPTIKSIYTCTITDWSNVPNSGKTGAITAYRRNDLSGTTDVFKTLVGISTFGSCVIVVATTEDIANHTSNESGAIGYAGLSGLRVDANKALAVAKTSAGPFVAPSTTTIRNFSYPLARRLYVNNVSDGRTPSSDEQQLLDAMTNRSFMDPILTANEFVTCLPVSQGGCP